jgi:hypothetical protein
MYVQRETIQVKFGRLQELLDMGRGYWSETGATVYLPVSGALDVIAIEREYESLAAMEEGVAALVEAMKAFPKAEMLDRSDELVVSKTIQTWYKE